MEDGGVATVPLAGRGATATTSRRPPLKQVQPVKAQPLQAMKEAFQTQLRGSRKHPKDGLFQHGPGPAGPLSSLQTARLPPTAGLLPGLGGRQLGPRMEPGLWSHQTLGFTFLICKMGPVASTSSGC